MDFCFCLFLTFVYVSRQWKLKHLRTIRCPLITDQQMHKWALGFFTLCYDAFLLYQCWWSSAWISARLINILVRYRIVWYWMMKTISKVSKVLANSGHFLYCVSPFLYHWNRVLLHVGYNCSSLTFVIHCRLLFLWSKFCCCFLSVPSFMLVPSAEVDFN